VSRFEGSGPVGRHWLARCEGFAVDGDVRGVVESVVRADDPVFAAAVVVRGRGRRERVIPVAAVESVDPHERTLVVARPARSRRPVPGTRTRGSRLRNGTVRVRVPAGRIASHTHDGAVRLGAAAVHGQRALGRSLVAATATGGTRLRHGAVRVGAPVARLPSRARGGVVRVPRTATWALPAILAGSFRRLGWEVLASVPWRPFVRFVRSAMRWTISRASSLLRTTSSRLRSVRRSSRATRTTSST